MTKVFRAGGLALALGTLALCTGSAFAKPIYMPTIGAEIQHDRAAGAITPPAPPCPQYAIGLSCTPVPETPATGIPFPGNMAYYGGKVEVTPKVYLVYWGWGETGAFPGQTCSLQSITEGSISATLACDPDGAGRYMANFVGQMGGTPWAAVANQYYQSSASGTQTHINTGGDVLAGIWADDTNAASPMASSSGSNAAGSSNTETLMAQEASRAVQHFGITDLTDSNIVILEPPAFSDPDALTQGYCAFHDYTVGGGVYDSKFGITQGMAYTNMPYINSIGGGAGCGKDAVNPSPAGDLDGFSVVLGHEIMETVTDPGAEYAVGTGPTYLGGWYDTVDGNENGDKCAWVGLNPLTGTAVSPAMPGEVGDITGSGGGSFAVQSTWSNAANEGTGYCAGVNDSPLPDGS